MSPPFFTHAVIDLSVPAKHQFNQEDADDAGIFDLTFKRAQDQDLRLI